jgi:hypothetical protein
MLVLTGCSHSDPNMGSLESKLKMKDKEIAELSASNKDKAKTIESYRMQLDKEAAAKAEAERRYNDAMASGSAADSDLFPPNAKPGECWARTFVAPTYRTVTETVQKKSASQRVELIPARYEFVEERVLVKEASSRMEVIPAQYEWTEEQVMVKAPSAELIEVPASYEWQEERILVKEAHTAWKKGRGPIEKVDNITGEIMCLVEVPASYKTVKKRVMTSPPSSRKVEIPAEYQTVKKRIMTKPPEQRLIEIPAEYKTVKVRKMVTPPQENKIEIPAEYAQVTRTEKVTEGHMEWRRILCETNVDSSTIARIQQALLNSGHNPGPIDGVLGSKTHAAVKSFQREHGLATGGLTHETISKLGINL